MNVPLDTAPGSVGTAPSLADGRPAPAHLEPIALAIDLRVRALLDAEIERWTAIDADLAHPLNSLKDLVLAGGKRLRPAFCHWAFVGAGGDPADPIVVDAGAGLELLHTFALVHDDVMDGSVVRRGMPAVHTQFIDEHDRQNWRSEARRFGEGVAILVGDLAFVYADILLKDANPSAAAVFTELRVEVNVGQYLDLLGSVRGNPSLESARRICQYKSGKYTIERPLHLGAALANRLADHEAALTEYGLPLGEAFQLRDDLLGALGDPIRTGKPVGDDLREGKPTALVARALEEATSAQREKLQRIGAFDLDADEIGDLQTILYDTGAASATESAIAELRDVAVAAMETSKLTAEAREALIELAYFVTDRSF